MPRFVRPECSPQHRVAAIALYRGLLSRCSSAPLPADNVTSLHNAIRNKFRRNRHIQSPHQLQHAFRAGYEILHHLDAASSQTGDTNSLKCLSSLIATLPQRLKRTPPLPPPPPPPKPTRTQFSSLPPDRAVLNVRPYAKTSGPRHVPILCSANGVPFLRLKKPQPPALSRVIRQKLRRRIALFDRRVMLSNYWLPLGRQEDEWDHILEEHFGLETQGQETYWADAMSSADRQAKYTYQKLLEDDRRVARRMQELVDEETKLAEQEGQKIVRGGSHWLK